MLEDISNLINKLSTYFERENYNNKVVRDLIDEALELKISTDNMEANLKSLAEKLYSIFGNTVKFNYVEFFNLVELIKKSA